MPQRSVAVVGASTDRSKYGNKSVRAHLREGWTVYPVNGRGGQVEGLDAYASLEDVPAELDRVTLYLPAERGMAVLLSIAAARPAEFFVNPGAESDDLIAEARRLGLEPILACSIVDVGASPAEFPG